MRAISDLGHCAAAIQSGDTGQIGNVGQPQGVDTPLVVSIRPCGSPSENHRDDLLKVQVVNHRHALDRQPLAHARRARRGLLSVLSHASREVGRAVADADDQVFPPRVPHSMIGIPSGIGSGASLRPPPAGTGPPASNCCNWCDVGRFRGFVPRVDDDRAMDRRPVRPHLEIVQAECCRPGKHELNELRQFLGRGFVVADRETAGGAPAMACSMMVPNRCISSSAKSCSV